MDILIRDMDMPSMCGECPCCEYDDEYHTYYCMALKNWPNIINENIIRDDCPLVELPKKHSRLIDADDLYGVIAACIHNGRFENILRAIEEAPTIIEIGVAE